MRRIMQLGFVSTAMVFAAALGGCTSAPVAIKTPYNIEEHEPYRLEGKNSVTGQAFMRQAGGGTVSCAGTPATLFPDTAFFREAIDIASRGLKPDASGQARPNRDGSSFRRAVCDAQGNFAFERVPSGRWILVAEVRWWAGPYSPQGGMLRQEVEVKEGSTNRFLLTDADLYRAR